MKSRKPRVFRKRRLKDAEIFRDFKKLELRQAQEVYSEIEDFIVGHEANEVAEWTGVPKTLVEKIIRHPTSRGMADPSALVDLIYWARRCEEVEASNETP